MAVQDPNYPVKLAVTYAGVYGAILLAVMINLCLYGMGLLLVLLYFRRHAQHDPISIKLTIMTLIVLATLQTAFSCHQVYDAFITKLGNLERLDEIVFSVPGEWLCGYLTAFVAEVFFCSRIWISGKRMRIRAHYLAIPAIILAVIQIGAGIAQAALMSISKYYTKLTMSTGLLIATTAAQGACASLSDIIISATLCYIFNAHRSAVGRTNSMINRLITYAVNRAVATTVCAVAAVVLYYFCSGTYYFIIPLFASTHLYLISAVSMLTSRDDLREQAEPSFHISNLDMSTIGVGANMTSSYISERSTEATTVAKQD